MDGITYSLGTFLTTFTEEYHVSYAEASFVLSLLTGITYTSGPISSIFTNKFSCRITVIIGTVVAALGFFFVEPVFMYFCISIFLMGLAFTTPYIFIVDQAIHSFNVDPENADILLSSIGISSSIGKIVIGYLAGLKKVNKIYLFSAILTICGISTIIEPMAIYFSYKNLQFIWSLIYSLTFGIFSGKI
jgi:predicted MFS family arabinose efflux permease